jgi:murein DD-endopeptidase MepM/ murein hydrolase activator NlpD
MTKTRGEDARAWRRRLIVLGGAAVLVAGASALAEPLAERAAVARAAPVQATAQAVSSAGVERLVWAGVDIDGDSQADFANPTGQGLRATDAYGCGDFGASRDGGAREHEGVDFMAQAGQPVAAPISGYVTRIGYAYPGDTELKFVEITNPALRYAARVFYVDPSVEVGQAVQVGAPIGAHHTLGAKYPGGMTDHVHLEIIDRRGERIDATRMIVARYERASAPRG